jgi:ribosomal protein L44E
MRAALHALKDITTQQATPKYKETWGSPLLKKGKSSSPFSTGFRRFQRRQGHFESEPKAIGSEQKKMGKSLTEEVQFLFLQIDCKIDGKMISELQLGGIGRHKANPLTR